ncbi:MAG: DUF86 domain-containing protein [Chloroflexota bacterium]|nr:DUF86 domain-containing protein [Chloroflexota bacterium]
MNEIILNKKISIERCILQIDTYYALDSGIPFAIDYLRQDAISMNLQRACELTIDIANYLIKSRKLGLPQDSRDSFALLQHAGLITIEQMSGLQAMVGFRNTLVHQYQSLNLQIMVDVIEHHLRELLDFAQAALDATG